MPQLLRNSFEGIRSAQSQALEFAHALLGVAVPEPMSAGRPPQRSIRGRAVAARPTMATSKVIVLLIVNPPVRNLSGSIEAQVLQSNDKLVRNDDLPNKATFAVDGVEHALAAEKFLAACRP